MLEQKLTVFLLMRLHVYDTDLKINLCDLDALHVAFVPRKQLPHCTAQNSTESLNSYFRYSDF